MLAGVRPLRSIRRKLAADCSYRAARVCPNANVRRPGRRETRETETETESERETYRQRHRETETQTERERGREGGRDVAANSG